MKYLAALTCACLVGVASAVDMSRYDPATGVESAFEAYLKELYNQTEILDATTSFTDYFTPDGSLIVLDMMATGAQNITALKQQLLPPNGNQRWSHFPNSTSVYSESSTEKVYYVQGIINKLIVGQNCSAGYYKSMFTVEKSGYGTLDLTPHSGNLAIYNDFYVEPAEAPSNIPCAS